MQCGFCDGKISGTAKNCMHCGKPTAAGRDETRRKRLGYVAAAIGIPIAVFIILAVIGSNAPQDVKAIRDAQRSIRANLRDPSSAKFGEAAYHDGAVCGVVNARNAMGGLTGDTRYIVLKDGRGFFEGPSDTLFHGMWAEVCL